MGGVFFVINCFDFFEVLIGRNLVKIIQHKIIT